DPRGACRPRHLLRRDCSMANRTIGWMHAHPHRPRLGGGDLRPDRHIRAGGRRTRHPAAGRPVAARARTGRGARRQRAHGAARLPAAARRRPRGSASRPRRRADRRRRTRHRDPRRRAGPRRRCAPRRRARPDPAHPDPRGVPRMSATPVSRPPRARLPLSMWVVAVALPLVVGAMAVALQLAWLPQLPDPIAMHWGSSGPDGYGPAWSTPVLTAGLSLGLTALFAAFLATARQPAPTASHKFLAVLSAVTAVFI